MSYHISRREFLRLALAAPIMALLPAIELPQPIVRPRKSWWNPTGDCPVWAAYDGWVFSGAVWPDQSGNGHHAIAVNVEDGQMFSVVTPHATAVNSVDGWRFNGEDQHLILTREQVVAIMACMKPLNVSYQSGIEIANTQYRFAPYIASNCQRVWLLVWCLECGSIIEPSQSVCPICALSRKKKQNP